MDRTKSDQAERIDEIADQLDEVKATVDELETDEGGHGDGAVDRLKTAVDRARDAADELEEQGE
jgi:methyl-accepting chemotaxis protein